MSNKNIIKASLIFNPTSGQLWNNFDSKFVQDFLIEHNWEVNICPTQKKGDAQKFAKDSVDHKYDYVIVAGGDGTLNEVIQSIAGKDIKLFVLPVGTTNVLARELEIPLNYKKALKSLYKGKTIEYDLGIINNHYFLLMVGIGTDAIIINDVDHKLKKVTGMAAYAAATAKSILKHQAAKMRINLWRKGRKVKKIKRTGYQVLISNSSTYANDWKVAKHAKYNDGLLDIVIFKNSKFIEFFFKMVSLAVRKKVEKSFYDYFQVSKMTIKTEPKQPIQVDGDIIGYTPANIEIRPKYLKILVP